MDDERLKNGGWRYFRELLQRIRDIRSSERNLYQDDVKVAQNYLSERELQVLSLLVSQFLDFAELQALEERAMTMAKWVDELDRQLLGNRRELLMGKGRISHKKAVEKAEKEFELYRAREMRQLESDFDRAVKELAQKDAFSSASSGHEQSFRLSD